MISLPPVVFSRWLMGHTCEPIKVGAERKIKRGTEWTMLCIVARGCLRCVFHYVRLNAKPCDRLCLHQHIVPPCLGLLGSDQQECLLYSDDHVAAVFATVQKSSCYCHSTFQDHFCKPSCEACIYVFMLFFNLIFLYFLYNYFWFFWCIILLYNQK